MSRALQWELDWVDANPDRYEGPWHRELVKRSITARYLRNALVKRDVAYTGDPETIYKYLGTSKGAGTSKGEILEVYWCFANNQLYHRTPGDFRDRIQDAK